jgi:hypothetical protein
MIGLGIGELLILLVIVLVSSPIYFAPLIVAFMRGHKSRTAIAVVNFLFGWSGVGWIALLIWSFVGESERR